MISSLADVFDAPVLRHFGYFGPGKAADPESFYGRLDDKNLTFDVSNNQMLCSVTATGLLEHACVVTGLGRYGVDCPLRGAAVYKEVAEGGPWPFAVEIDGRRHVLHELPGVRATLVAGVFPKFTWQAGGITVSQLVLAPIDIHAPTLSPRALLVLLAVEGAGPDAPAARVLPPPAASDHEAIRPLLNPAAGGRAVSAFAVCLAADGGELARTADALAARTPLEWVGETFDYHARRAGRLEIPADPFYAESFGRLGELCRQTVLHLADGRFAGGFWGSRFRGKTNFETPFIWIKDVYHAALPMGLLHPWLAASAALWFAEWAIVPEPFGRGLGRFTNVLPVTHSLTNSVSAFVLAGEYYRATGDAEFFRERPDLLAHAEKVFADILSTRQGEPFLFPSLYISDGDARGDYHSGSNLLLCAAFREMSRLAGEAYGRGDLAAAWGQCAEKLHAAILAHCVGDSPDGRRLFEGANADGTGDPCHDGEETDTTLAPFHGLMEPDDEALLRHGQLALSKTNSLYWPEMDAVWWVDGPTRHFGATFPAWIAALAGAADEPEMLRQLSRVRSLTDLDGSIWWWPYRPANPDGTGAPDATKPERSDMVMKCGWAAGVYCLVFVNNLLGLRADASARTVAFRPFNPWPEFSWTGAALGESVFDVSYVRSGESLEARLTNRNAEAYDALIELTPPAGATVSAREPAGVTAGRRYGRPTAILRARIEAGETACLKVGLAVC